MGLSFKHSGKIGDIIYSLPFIETKSLDAAHGINTLYIPINPWMSEKDVEFIKPLLEYQGYVTKVKVWNGEHIDYDLDRFREVINKSFNRSIVESFYNVFGVETNGWWETEPWLKAPENYKKIPVVINRVLRGYQNLHGLPIHHEFYDELVSKKLANASIFVGFPDEWKTFMAEYECNISYKHTQTALDLASVIQSGEMCVMNQSSPCAIAEGLKKTMYLERRKDVPGDCTFNRPNLFYI